MAATNYRNAFSRGVSIPVPTWVPSVGTIADIGLNSINSVKGTDTATPNIFKAWSGAGWAPWWGAYGSMVFSGEGHTDGGENAVYRYDVETRLVSKLKNSAPIYIKSDTYCADGTTGWMWANATGGDTAVQTGEPGTGHFYSSLMALPTSAFPLGGGTNGWLYTPGRVAFFQSGQRGTAQAHKMRLGIDQLWTLQGGGSSGFTPEYGPGIYDSLRNRVWTIASSTTFNIRWRDLTLDTYGTTTTTGSVDLNSFYAVGGYHKAQDLLMIVRQAAGVALWFRIVDLATNIAYAATVSGTGPSVTYEGAWDWSDTWNAWVFYEGNGGNTIYFLKAPANPRTGTWVWSSQTFTGTARINDIASPGYNRLRHCPALGNLVIWAPLYNQPMQGINVNTP